MILMVTKWLLRSSHYLCILDRRKDTKIQKKRKWCLTLVL